MKLSRKNLGRVATTFLATAMLASLTAVPAFAVEENPEPGKPIDATSSAEITFNKTITKPENVYLPNATFTFSVEDYTGMQNVQPGAVTITDNTIASSPSASDVGEGKTKIVVSDTASVNVDATKFSQPGEYEFTIIEADGKYEDATTDENDIGWASQKLTLKVYIKRDTDGMKVYGYSLYSESDPTDKLDGFTNAYMTDDEGEDITNKFDLNKVVDGDFATDADKTTKHFTFNIDIDNTALESATNLESATKWYKVVVTHTADCEYDGEDVAYITANDTAEQIMLAHGDKVEIYGLTDNETINVTEENYTSDGFQGVSYVIDSNPKVDDSYTITGGVNVGSDHSVTFTNTKSAVSPTGIAMDIAPYALLVVIAAAGCFVFLRKRNED